MRIKLFKDGEEKIVDEDSKLVPILKAEGWKQKPGNKPKKKAKEEKE